MSNEIFKWMPSLLDYEDGTSYRTLVSEFETGAEQRRAVWQRERGRWRLNFLQALLDKATTRRVQDEIMAFFKARQGGFDNFWLPSWELECTVSAFASTYVETIESPTDMGFSATAGDQGNYLYICNHYYVGYNSPSYTHEVKQISSITQPGNYRITIVGSFNNTYSVGARLQKAFKVVFTNDELVRGFECPYIWKSPLEFKEDLADLYTAVASL